MPWVFIGFKLNIKGFIIKLLLILRILKILSKVYGGMYKTRSNHNCFCFTGSEVPRRTKYVFTDIEIYAIFLT